MWITVDNMLVNLNTVQCITKQDKGCIIDFGNSYRNSYNYILTEESFESLQSKILSAVSMYK